MSILATLSVKLHHISAFWRLRQHFNNPWLIAGLRLGLLKMEYFPYRISKDSHSYVLLGRPRTGSSTDLFVLREVLAEETYRDVLPLLPDRALRVVDIGANLGATTIWLSRKVRLKQAFCFEPEPDSFRLLRFNLAKNGCSCACAIPKAVGGKSRTARMVLDEHSPGGTNIYATPADNQASIGSSIEVVALSEWLRETPDQFDLLKMDCEGAEWEIVRNTPASELARFGAVAAEIHEDPERQQPVESFAELIESRGFKTIRWDRKSAGLYFGIRDSERKA
ncbi:MAG TPA: FkbM family methyltransferase [Candidatus Paceibacterota bacterium]|nr:FkbM family methyltransferase [Verrucomicrobiota bacterium]HSA12403.1 FkbM family methyltransferase [Candidatus Paceibacterota bacterium]